MENPFSSILASTARGRSDSVATAPTRVGAENSAAAANIPSSRSSDALSSLGLEGTPSKGISSAGGSSCSSSSSSSNNNSNVRSGMGKIGSPGGAPAPVPSSSAKKGLSRPSSFRMMDSPAPKTPQKPSANADSAAASALGRCRSTSKETRDQARGLPASLGLSQTSLTVKTAPVCKTLDRAFSAKNGHGVGPLPPQPPNKTVILAKQRAAVRKIRTQKDSIGFTAPAAASEEEVALARRRQSMAITSEIKTLVQRAEEEQALELGLEEAEVGVEVGDVEQSGRGDSSDAVQAEAGGEKVIIAADAIAGVSPSRLSAVVVPRSSDSKSRPRISSDDATGRKRESLLQDSALISKMLPRKVCLHVREGKPVPPEFFSNVSIFFSDVVGFTNISAAVEPIHVIRLLVRLPRRVLLIPPLPSRSVYHSRARPSTVADTHLTVSSPPLLRPHPAEHALHGDGLCHLAVPALQGGNDWRR